MRTRSPFPGMDPWLEKSWGGIHARLITDFQRHRKGDPAVVIDLQEPIDQAYQLGSYGKRIDYSKPPVPPLSSEDAQWAAGLINQTAVAG